MSSTPCGSGTTIDARSAFRLALPERRTKSAPWKRAGEPSAVHPEGGAPRSRWPCRTRARSQPRPDATPSSRDTGRVRTGEESGWGGLQVLGAEVLAESGGLMRTKRMERNTAGRGHGRGGCLSRRPQAQVVPARLALAGQRLLSLFRTSSPFARTSSTKAYLNESTSDEAERSDRPGRRARRPGALPVSSSQALRQLLKPSLTDPMRHSWPAGLQEGARCCASEVPGLGAGHRFERSPAIQDATGS